MLDKEILDRYQFDAEGLAEEFSNTYFSLHDRRFPINPFQVLTDLNIPFVFRNFDKLEGAFFPEDNEEMPMICKSNPRYCLEIPSFTAAQYLKLFH